MTYLLTMGWILAHTDLSKHALGHRLLCLPMLRPQDGTGSVKAKCERSHGDVQKPTVNASRKFQVPTFTSALGMASPFVSSGIGVKR